MNIIVGSDYDGYFEGLTKRIVALVTNPKYETVIVSAGPYRAYSMYLTKIDDKTCGIDYYSAIRAGFGSLSEDDLISAAKLLSN